MTMDRLEQIKNAVTANGMREWTDERVGQAMREYSAQQNVELDKMGEHLSAENSDLSSQIEGLKYDKERLRERVEELQSQLTKYRGALERIIVESEDNERVDWMYVAENMVEIAKEALKKQ